MYQMLYDLSDYVGLMGVSLILGAYLLLSLGKLKATHLVYPMSNFIGAWFILFSLYFHWNLSSVVIEIAWVLISLTGIIRFFMQARYAVCDARS